MELVVFSGGAGLIFILLMWWYLERTGRSAKHESKR